MILNTKNLSIYILIQQNNMPLQQH